jgi:hypothetical protein
MELRALRYLAAVVEAGSFAGAAVQLGMNSSNLTRQISSLEDELGLTLLERSRSGVRLTSGGAAVMIEVRRMFADLDAIAKAARANGVGKHGEFRLGLRVPPVGDRLDGRAGEGGRDARGPRNPRSQERGRRDARAPFLLLPQVSTPYFLNHAVICAHASSAASLRKVPR